MSKKRQTPIFDPAGLPGAQLTTLAYDYDDGHLVEEHFHREGQLLFASHGVMTVRTERSLWVVPPLRAVWIPARQPHSILMSGKVKMRTLYFAPSVLGRTPQDGGVRHVSPVLRELILHACTRAYWRVRMTAHRRFLDFLLDQLAESKVIPVHLPRLRDERAVRVAENLIADPGDGSSLEVLSRRAGASRRTIERAFVGDTGMTFGKWRQQLRLLHGMRLLAAGEKVTAAALDVGYQSPSAFISAFKKALGTTPRQFPGS